jgi:hypothetical protein
VSFSDGFVSPNRWVMARVASRSRAGYGQPRKLHETVPGDHSTDSFERPLARGKGTFGDVAEDLAVVIQRGPARRPCAVPNGSTVRRKTSARSTCLGSTIETGLVCKPDELGQ